MAEKEIRRAAVLGAGVMGANIAAHLANVGIPVYLMDIVPKELTDEESKKGLTLESPAVRNRLAQQAKNNLPSKGQMRPLYDNSFVDLITVGNFEDNMEWISECDWVIEVIVENMDIKKKFYPNVEKHWKKGSIVSTNTSGLSINEMVSETSDQFKQHFLGTHFFNPPRYMKLLEIIPHEKTSKDVIDFMSRFCERVLGKGVVFAKDTPNFIANRMGTYTMMVTMKTMQEKGMSIEEVDSIAGAPMGNPKTATFRTGDLVGLDVLYHTINTVYQNTQDPKEKETMEVPDFLQKMVEEKGWLGDKTGQGFYKKEKTPEGTKRMALDYNTLEYRERQKPSFDIIKDVKDMDLEDRLQRLYDDDGKVGDFVRTVAKRTVLFAASRIPEIADDVVNLDRGVKWGFNRRVGPFEMFDAIGVKKIVDDAKKEGYEIPPLVNALLEKGYETFYKKIDHKWHFFDLETKEYQPVPFSPEEIDLALLKEQNKLIMEEPGHGSLIDLGDGITCLEMHTPRQAISPEFTKFIFKAIDETEKNYRGMVISNQADNFCVGANVLSVLMGAQSGEWDELKQGVKDFQDACMRIKYSRIPVVAAPFGQTLGGGMEICLHANRVQAAAETYMGQVEMGVGLLPGGGGNKEVLLRQIEGIPEKVKTDMMPFVQKALEYILQATVATSAFEAKSFNFLRDTDNVTVNRDFLIHDAKNTVLAMLQEGWQTPRPKPITVTGKYGMGAIVGGLKVFEWGKFMSEHDRLIGEKVGRVLTGGYLEPNTQVSEQYLLDVEREAFVELCAEQKTQERIQHLLTTGKPLRN